MHFFKWLSQPKLSFLLAIYIGIFLNITVFYRRFSDLSYGIRWINVFSVLAEVLTMVLFTFILMRIASLGGRLFYRVIATLLVLISVAASYYMTFFNVVIGYGIVASVVTADLNLTREMIGYHLGIWMVLVSALPLWLIWFNPLKFTLLEQLRTPGQRLKPLLAMVIAGLLIWLPLRLMDNVYLQRDAEKNIDMPNYAVVMAYSYLPTNWVGSLGMFVYTQLHEKLNRATLLNPADKYRYLAPPGIDDTYVVFIIGETTRWDHMGMLGYHRNTTPLLSHEKNLVVFKGQACDTATRLSLRCMFVRKSGVADSPQRTLKERNIFAVLRSLGFTSELFSTQGDVWFYSSVNANSYSSSERIAAEIRSDNQRIDDRLLVNELQRSLKRYPAGKHLVILHTAGSHYLYSHRYPPSFAHYQPECMGIDTFCTKAKLINAYDNTMLYADTVIKEMIDQVRDKKAIVFYAADHGESIDENSFFHGTPRNMAPPEQLRVPIMVWASDKYLADPQHKARFAQLKAQQRLGVTQQHTQLFDSILGCLGYRSPDGGIVEKNNWCHIPAE